MKTQKRIFTFTLILLADHALATLAMMDTMNHIKQMYLQFVSEWQRLVGALVLIMREQKEKDSLFTNSEIMIHQPMGGAEGQASDIEIRAKQILKASRNLK